MSGRHVQLNTAFVFALIATSCSGGLIAQQKAPFDLFEQPIDNRVIYRHFEKRATGMMRNQTAGEVAAFQRELLKAPRSSDLLESSLTTQRATKPSEVYRHMVKSTIYIGELYNCGRCDRTHAGFSGGVVISEDGLALTNYHVLESRDTGRTEGIYAMTWDGKCWAIDEILAASKNDDVALVRLKGGNYKFYASPLAAKAPVPMDPIRIISHPFGEFFVMTHGEVSRYARMRKKRDSAAARKATWMEVTAPFGSGSSGCGVFNNRGEVVGLVSSILPLFRKASEASESNPDAEARARYVEMLIRKCVPLDAIDACFASQR